MEVNKNSPTTPLQSPVSDKKSSDKTSRKSIIEQVVQSTLSKVETAHTEPDAKSSHTISDKRVENDPIPSEFGPNHENKTHPLRTALVQQRTGIPGELSEEKPNHLIMNGLPLDDRFALPLISSSVVQKDEKFEGYDPKNNTITMIIENEEKGEIKYIKVTLNLDETSEKLLTSKETLIDAAKSGKLDTLFEAKKKKFKNLDSTHDTIDRLASEHTHVPKQQIIKISRAFHKASPQGLSAEFSVSQTSKRDGSNKYGFSQSIKILALSDGDKKLALLNKDTEKELGFGCFATAVKMTKLFSSEEVAVKVSHTDQQIAQVHNLPTVTLQDKEKLSAFRKKSNADIENDHDVLKHIWEGESNVVGINEPPSILFDRQGSKGYMTRLADGDGFALSDTPEFADPKLNPIKLDCCHQILQGGALLERKNVIHADQKIDNLLFNTKKDATGKVVGYVVKTADFGGAIISSEPVARALNTKMYFPSSDWGNVSLATNVFQAGLQLCTFLTIGSQLANLTPGEPVSFQYPYPLDANGYRDTNEPFDKSLLVKLGVPDKLIDLIEDMMKPIPEERPTAAVSLARF